MCDITTSNANVAYVLGIAEARGVPIIVIKAVNAGVTGQMQLRYRSLNYHPKEIDVDFLDALVGRIKQALLEPSSFRGGAETTEPDPSRLFISYSHRDGEYLERLMVHLKPLGRDGEMDIWSDRRLRAGDDWKDEIRQALGLSNAAILLVSADFLASDFVIGDELPLLLEKAEREGARVLPVVLSPCRFARDSLLKRFQAVNDPARPLSAMDRHSQEEVFDRVAQEVERQMIVKGRSG